MKLKIAAFFAKFMGLNFTAMLGPIGIIANGALSLVAGLIKMTWEAIQVVFTKPVVLILLVIVLAYGFRVGIKFDRYLVTKAQTETETLKNAIEGAEDADKARADAAIAAREAAKRQEPLSLVGSVGSATIITSVPPQTSKLAKPADTKAARIANGVNNSSANSKPRRLRNAASEKDRRPAVKDGVFRF